MADADKPTGKALQDALFRSSGKEITDCDATLFEQYKLYVEMLDRISERRQHANSFFLGINTGLCAFVGFLFTKDVDAQLRHFLWAVPIAGILLSYFWMRMVASYRDLNTGKFAVIHEMEKRLPVAPYHAEWVAIGEGKDPKKYTPFTHLEIWIPRGFILMYVVLGIYFYCFRPFATNTHEPKSTPVAVIDTNPSVQVTNPVPTRATN